MVSFPGLGDEQPRTCPLSTREISITVSDMAMGPWISSLIVGTLERAQLASGDFMGRSDEIVSIQDLVEAMCYYATVAGYSPEWESVQPPPPVFEDFQRRSRVYESLCKKVQDWTTLGGSRKLVSVKKTIRQRVGEKAEKMRARPNSMGVFVGDGADIAPIYGESDHKTFFCNLHRLGNFPEDNPRFYIHMVFRYYVNELHKHLAQNNMVLRFPSLQKVMDVKHPVDCVASTPPEFRTFLKNARGSSVNVATLPVPSKTEVNEVVYEHNFESEVQWVPVMRSRIFDVFVELTSSTSRHLIRDIYPKYLVKGPGGCPRGNQAVTDALARTIEMNDLVKALDGFAKVDEPTKKIVARALSVEPGVASVFCRYSGHQFTTKGEQLQERLGFLLQDSVRGLFRRISNQLPSFSNDVYIGLGIPYGTVNAFEEYCTGEASMPFQSRGEGVWRDFIIGVCKICCMLHAWSRKREVEEFLSKHRSADGFFKSVLHDLA